MKISRVSVKNFRSIKDVEIEPNDFSIFVGQNNHGKTNLFEAIEWFYTAKSSPNELFFDKKPENTIEVEVEYSNISPDDIEKLSTETNKSKIKSLLGTETSFSIKKRVANISVLIL